MGTYYTSDHEETDQPELYRPAEQGRNPPTHGIISCEVSLVVLHTLFATPLLPRQHHLLRPPGRRGSGRARARILLRRGETRTRGIRCLVLSSWIPDRVD